MKTALPGEARDPRAVTPKQKACTKRVVPTALQVEAVSLGLHFRNCDIFLTSM